MQFPLGVKVQAELGQKVYDMNMALLHRDGCLAIPDTLGQNGLCEGRDVGKGEVHVHVAHIGRRKREEERKEEDRGEVCVRGRGVKTPCTR